MTVNVLGQLNINGVEIYTYQFPKSPASPEGELYFSHVEILPFMFLGGDFDNFVINVSASDLIDFPSTKQLETRHVFIKAEAFARLSKLEIFDDPNWTDLIHPIILQL